MGTDRARNSFDASRQYRSVVAQQGRVSVEADANEAELIRGVEARADLIDIIGPAGSPDLGYKIVIPPGTAAYGFAFQHGTLYVGGLRLELATQRTYAAQKLIGGPPPIEWADAPAADPDVPTALSATEVIYLELAEQEVTAVEDPALREVALGGPDTAGRTRLIQRVRRGPQTATGCVSGLIALLAERSPALVFDRATMQLTSKARLAVDFVPVADADNACQPIARAGFLGAENQLIRVQVAQGGNALLWGYDNASSLYRVKPPIGGVAVQTLVLEGTPVDEMHRPRPHQWAEVLRSAVKLDAGSYVAAAVGEPHEIDSYDAATNSITLMTPVTDAGGPQLFVRIWERRIGYAGAATELVDSREQRTGVRVTATGTGQPGDYWMIGVRPTHPDTLYPARLRQPQRPDGPNRWAAPLATIAWKNHGAVGLVHDCRRPFKPLIEHDDGDLAFHNKHLHGWGVVCGLQVRCMTAPVAERLHLERPHEWVNLFNGYAIDPHGHDIRWRSGTNDKFVPIDLGTLAVDQSGVLTRDAAGQLPDATLSLWIDHDRTLHVEEFTPKQTSVTDALAGTLLLDIYNDCILNVVEYVTSALTDQPGGTALVGPGAKRLIAVLNLVIQLVNQQSGRHVYLSGEIDPARARPDTEDAILRALFEGLRALLESKSLCRMFDGVDYPSYDGVYRAGFEKRPHPTTIFGTGRHQRIRISPRLDPQLALTCGTGVTINAYDLTTNQIAAISEFPVPGAEVQDVAFSIDGGTIYAIAWTGPDHAETTFAVGDLAATGTIQWREKRLMPSLKLVTLATSDFEPDRVFAAARGTGVVAINPGALVANPPFVQEFRASGHLVALEAQDQTFLFAGEHLEDTNPTGFTQIRNIDVAKPQVVTIHRVPDLGGGDGTGIGYDDIGVAYSPEFKTDYLCAIVEADPGEKRLLIWDHREPGYPTQPAVPLGASKQCRIAYSGAFNWSLITYDETYLGRAYRPKRAELEPGFHPLQIAPISVARDGRGRAFYVLEWGSNTITAIPMNADQEEPWQSAIDVPGLEAYRVAALTAFLGLLGRFVQYLKDCVCDHLLVNCPDARNKRVYLADISIKDGAVYQICNFHHRRYVHTFPTVEYWMSLVPIIPLIKLAVEKLCCSVFTDVFDRYVPPEDRTKATSDNLSMAMVRNGVGYVREANLGRQYTERKVQLLAGAKLGRAALVDQPPPAGKAAGPVHVASFVDGSVDNATKVAATKGIAVGRVVTASDPIMTAFRAGFATPTVERGDTIDLVTDARGKVIGVAKAAPAGDVAGAPAAPAADDTAAPTGEVAKLKRDLKTMKDQHQKHVTTISEMQTQMKELRAALDQLAPKPR